MRKQRLDAPKVTKELLDKHLSFYYVQDEADYFKEKSEWFTSKKVPARQCTQEDFGSSKLAKGIFDSWVGFYLICPDITPE